MSRILVVFKKTIAWAREHKLRASLVLFMLMVASPTPLRSQIVDPCCAVLTAGLTMIANTLRDVIGGDLSKIDAVEQDNRDFEENIVWNQKLINDARSLVATVRGTLNRIQAIAHIPINSATLPATQQLEGNLLSRDPGQIAQTGSQYTAVYGPVPDASAASPETRNLIDMQDAEAQAAMKRAIAIDAIADLELEAADQFHQSLETAAPGSAPIIEAEVQAWLVRGNAYTLQAMAERMRVDAIESGEASADLKNGATNSTAIQQQIYNLLKRP